MDNICHNDFKLECFDGIINRCNIVEYKSKKPYRI